uniref:Peptidase A1 domain-containing protein n=1 Tax=Kalanchoe fedtschenkoi TaxID=63787 RepID=A0A7N0V4F4_KALFE
MQDGNLNQYIPSSSSTSKALPCGHRLCDLEPSCESPEETCTYNARYLSENTSSSGILVEDILHLSSSNSDGSTSSIRKRAIIGCGQKQSGDYLDGAAPDGLMGLGFGEKSLPSLLAKEKLVRNSFSMCFGDDLTGSILFGDQGLAGQQSTPFLPSDGNGNYDTYIIGVDVSCIGNSCFKETSFEAQVDSGTSFTFLPNAAYESIVQEFDKLVEEKRSSYEGSPWEYCYESSSDGSPKIPSMKFKFTSNSSFVVHNPLYLIYDESSQFRVLIGFCLAIQPMDGDVGIIGQNFMTGYRIVFDRENLRLGWSRSNCHDISDNKTMPLAPSANSKTAPPNPLPTSGQQNVPPKRPDVAPAVAGKTPAKSSADSNRSVAFLWMLFVLLSLHTYATAA